MAIDQQQVDAVTRDYQQAQHAEFKQRQELLQDELNTQRQALRLPVPFRPDGAYTMSKEGKESLKQWEKLRLEAYKPTPKDRPTIGYGHTLGVNMGDKIKSESEADQLLQQDIQHVQNDLIKRFVNVPLTQNQWDALVHFVYNMPQKEFKKSTLLKKLNAGQYDEVPKEMDRWVYQKGKKLDGLINRRKAEIAMWRRTNGR